jgi:hypothetical protein
MGNSLRKKPTFAVGRQNDLVKAVLETGKPTVVLLINSGPLSINYIAENVSFPDLDMKKVVEPGVFDVMVGTSSVKYEMIKPEVVRGS